MADKRNPGAPERDATEAGLPCQAEAADTPKLAQANRRGKRGWRYRIKPKAGESFTIHATGREAWALDRLHAAGPKGCTPIDEPAPRWSAYVHTLRERGVPIVTIRETHGGEFAGHHARYVLRATVQKGGAA